MKEKLEEILNSLYSPPFAFADENVDSVVSELLQLIEQERKNSVEGFIDYVSTRKFKVLEYGEKKKVLTSWSGEVIEKLRKHAKEYLTQLSNKEGK